ncbi:hypothetical protein GCM10028828_10300 [Corynebacterium tapiri]
MVAVASEVTVAEELQQVQAVAYPLSVVDEGVGSRLIVLINSGADPLLGRTLVGVTGAFLASGRH